MWNITIVNNFVYPVYFEGVTIEPGQTLPWPTAFGCAYITVPGIGQVNFTDIGETKISGFLKETWGILISYQGDEIEFRYEGGGKLQVTINQFGQAQITPLNGQQIQVRLNPFILS
jgi:hypothetical protein